MEKTTLSLIFGMVHFLFFYSCLAHVWNECSNKSCSMCIFFLLCSLLLFWVYGLYQLAYASKINGGVSSFSGRSSQLYQWWWSERQCLSQLLVLRQGNTQFWCNSNNSIGYSEQFIHNLFACVYVCVCACFPLQISVQMVLFHIQIELWTWHHRLYYNDDDLCWC